MIVRGESTTCIIDYHAPFDQDFTRESPKPLYFAMRWRRKMGKTKKDMNTRVDGRRKQTKESAAEQICMDNIPVDLNE